MAGFCVEGLAVSVVPAGGEVEEGAAFAADAAEGASQPGGVVFFLGTGFFTVDCAVRDFAVLEADDEGVAGGAEGFGGVVV